MRWSERKITNKLDRTEEAKQQRFCTPGGPNKDGTLLGQQPEYDEKQKESYLTSVAPLLCQKKQHLFKDSKNANTVSKEMFCFCFVLFFLLVAQRYR